MQMLKEKLILLFFLFTMNNFIYGAYCEQIISVKFIPEKGVKIYGVTGGSNSKRGIIDLGHFNGKNSRQTIKVGKVEVILKLEERSSGIASEYEIELINIKNLENALWNYSYDITPFIKNKDGVIANIRIENTSVSVKGTVAEDIIYFGCIADSETHEHPELNYSFDLILELEGIEEGGMYGISSPKNSGTEAYVNLKDLIKDQLSLSTAKP